MDATKRRALVIIVLAHMLAKLEGTSTLETITTRPLRAVGKVYDRCEFARELRYIHRVPAEQINTWTCIVENESDFNTAAIGNLDRVRTSYGKLAMNYG